MIWQMDPAYSSVLEKLDWAQEHIKHFQAAATLFRDANRNCVRKNTNQETGDVTYYIESVPQVPSHLSLMLGDAIHNLRSTLDYVAAAMEIAAGETPDKYTGFPIFDSPEGYRDSPPTKIKGLREPCKRIIDRIQPYKGGNGHRLWQLNKLDVLDKHRLLLTVGFVPTARTMTPSEREQFESAFLIPGEDRAARVSRTIDVMTGGAILKPPKAGQELVTVLAKDAHQNMGFAFDVAIHEPGIVEVFPALWFLQLASGEVSRAVNSMAPFIS
jgi:hypothetical protein